MPRWKQVLDISLVILALPLLLPLMLCIAVLIWVVSEGPILFRRAHVGLRGSRFMCFKFRTMHGTDTDAVKSPRAPGQPDWSPASRWSRWMSRATHASSPSGVPLRSSGLDELPQFINILRGEMSLVGPRPCVSYEYEKYLPWQKERFDTLPGLTGLWQVSGKNRTTFDEMIQFDIEYAREKNVAMDLLIIAKTIPALVIQMRDTRNGRKMLLRPVGPRATLSGRVVNQ